MEQDPNRLAAPLTENQLAQSRVALSKLSIPNRFRLMFGQPLFPEIEKEPKYELDQKTIHPHA